ncbi:hypothetical protein M3P36_09105 [Altererythrobacter sp. KTW20L]|uniref:hypothetical protein n=1 Tax=Altererythrobacter sp. KTW20L TaxID=2942210 RepID=UPI0020BF2173|nr:hypothetical protein [Altererythrobacter sp. KTW20L]MCL6251198.1 hypothetical protein [Altererythrobacter sp. KTW20L]
MSEERITEIHDDDGATHTHTTIVRDPAPERRGSMGFIWLILLVAIIAVAALVIFNQMGTAEVAKDNAVAGAAAEVGTAASQVGDAVEQGVDNLTE